MTKIRPPRNPIVRKMILRRQNAGPHTEQKKQKEKKALKDKILEELEEYIADDEHNDN